MEWISVDERMPDVDTKVLIVYEHKGKGYRSRGDGRFVTQARLEKCYGGRGLEWNDYMGRAIQWLEAKASNNKVTHWQPLLELPK